MNSPLLSTNRAADGKRFMLVLAAGIFVISLALRLFGIGWGLKNELHNQSYHPDEPLIFDFANRSHLFSGSELKEYYNYGTLYYAVLRGAGALGSVIGVPRPATLDLADNLASVKRWDTLNTYVSQWHLSGRIASAVAGSGTAVVVFLILLPLMGRLGGTAGAAFVAIAPAHVEHSRFQTVDVISLFFLSLAALATVRMLRPELEDRRAWWREVLLASALCGLAGGARYSNVLAVAGVLAVLVIRRPKYWPALALAGMAVALVLFLVATPGIVTDTEYFLANQRYQLDHARNDRSLIFVGRPSGFLLHLQGLLWGSSGVAALIGLVGISYAALVGRRWAWVLLAFFIPYYLSIGGMELKFLRYGFPLYIGVAAGFGYAISVVRARFNALVAAALMAIALIGVESSQAGLRGSLLFTRWMMGPDPRDEAGRYLKVLSENRPDLRVGFLGESPWFWTPAVVQDAALLRFLPPADRDAYLDRTTAPLVMSFMSGARPEYAMVSSFEMEDARRLRTRSDLELIDLSNVVAANQLLDALFEAYSVEKTFGQGGPTIHDLEYIRPEIHILKRKE